MSQTKFEKLIEYVVANDDKKARALFHQIVVDKSRKIYEALDMNDTERAFDDVETDHTVANDMTSNTEFGGDEADDLETDVFDDGEDSSLGMEGEELNPEIDDRVADLEQEFDALKAEFEELLHTDEEEDDAIEGGVEDEEEGLEGIDSAVEDHEDEEESLDDEVETDDSFEESEDEETEETEEDEEKEEPVDESVIREYVDKVTKGLANSTEDSFVQKKSPVSAKPSMVPGISAKNLNQGGVSQGRPNPKSGEFTSEKIANRPGANSGVKSLKPAPKPVTTKEEPGVNKKSVEA